MARNTLNNFGIASSLPRADKRRSQFARQRKQRGFDDTETWCLAAAHAKFIVPRLKRFKQVHNGHPRDISGPEWDDVLQSMIEGFEAYLQLDGSPKSAVQLEPKVAKGLRLFATWYRDLWW